MNRAESDEEFSYIILPGWVDMVESKVFNSSIVSPLQIPSTVSLKTSLTQFLAVTHFLTTGRAAHSAAISEVVREVSHGELLNLDARKIRDLKALSNYVDIFEG